MNMRLPAATPHRLDVGHVYRDLDEAWHHYASATTVDQTQVKRLWVRAGAARFRVLRRYLAGDAPPEVVYEGADLAEAIRLYNGLS